MIKIKIHSIVLKANKKRNESSVLHFARWHLISKVLHFSWLVKCNLWPCFGLEAPCVLSPPFHPFTLSLALVFQLPSSFWGFCHGVGGGVAFHSSYICRRLQTFARLVQDVEKPALKMNRFFLFVCFSFVPSPYFVSKHRRRRAPECVVCFVKTNI